MWDGIEERMVYFSARRPKEQEADSETKTTGKIAFGIKYTNINITCCKWNITHGGW